MSAQELITKNLDIWTSAHKTRSGIGRGSSQKLDLVGIKKLRQLILELAVTGKLVPQDPCDIPASELLEKYEADKAALIKEGLIKKDKQTQEDFLEGFESDFPENWAAVTFRKIGNWAIGNGFPEIEQGNTSGEFLFCKVSDMNLLGNEKFITSTVHTVTAEVAEKLKLKLHPEGTVIFPKIGGAIATNKRRLLIQPTAIDNNCLGLTPNLTIHSEYLYIYLLSLDLTKYQAGTSVPALSQGILEQIIFGLPPLTEQHRIVAKVDELMAFCDQLEQTQSDNIAAHAQLVEALLATLTNSSDHNELQNNWQRIASHFDTLFTTEHSIDQLKQTILQLAVMGKLVPQNPNDEPASEVLKKVAAEKALLIKKGKIKRENPLLEISDEEKPFELPAGWEWIRTGEAGEIKLGRQRSPKDHNGPHMVPYLRVANVHDNRIDITDVKEMNFTPQEQRTFALKYGDILLNEGQSKELVGRPAMYRDEVPQCCFQNTLLRFRSESFLYPQFALLYFRVCLYAGRFQKAVKQTTNMAHLSSGRLSPIEFPLPPLAEQRRIVAKVNELMALCDTLKTNLQNAQTIQLALADALVESVISLSHSSSVPVANEELSM